MDVPGGQCYVQIRMFPRLSLGRIALGLLLGVLLLVVLQQSNTRTIPAGLRASVTDTTSTSVNTAYVYCCQSNGSGCYQTSAGQCAGTEYADLASCTNACVTSASSASSTVYCCDQSGGCAATIGGCGAGETEYADDLSCMDSCMPQSSSSLDCSTVDDLNATDCCINPGPPYSAACCEYNPNWCEESSSEPACTTDADCPLPGDDAAHTQCCDGVCSLDGTCPSSSASEQWCCNAALRQCYPNTVSSSETTCVAGGACDCVNCVENCAPGECDNVSSSETACIAGGACDCVNCVENCAPGECDAISSETTPPEL